MTTDPTILAQQVADELSSSPPSAAVARDTSLVESELLSRLDGQGKRYLVRAPGRLDVMGGIAEYSGSLILNWPVEAAVYVAVHRRTDRKVSITHCCGAGNLPVKTQAGSLCHSMALSRLRAAAGQTNGELESVCDPSCDTKTRIVAAVLIELLRSGYLPDSFDGASIVTGSTLNHVADLGQAASLAAATVLAVCRAVGAAVEPMDAACLSQRVENHYLDMPCGVGDAVTALMGESARLIQVRCQPHELSGVLRLPQGAALLGIDCGLTTSDKPVRYRRVRTTTYMGRTLIERIVAHEQADRIRWDGYLARLRMTDFVERFRDRLPTKMKGKEFLQRFGETGDPLTNIEPAVVYKIRSRTEHHVYENARANQFAERLARAARIGDRRITAQAGELMYASHWSYGQRCGLGSIASDRMVTLLRRRGAEAGILGAKIAGRACGSLVAVLVDDTPEALAAVDEIRRQYETETGQTTSLLTGSSAGAMTAGVREFS